MKIIYKYLEEAKSNLKNKKEEFNKQDLINEYKRICDLTMGKYSDCNLSLAISPKNEEESLQYGNALANSGNYPVGLSGCFCVGISGGCGVECYVFQNGECENTDEVLEQFMENRNGTE